MKKTAFVLLLIASVSANAGGYMEAQDRIDTCDKMGEYAMFAWRLAQDPTGKQADVSKSAADLGSLRPMFAWVEEKIGKTPQLFDKNSARKHAWAYCMDNLEYFDEMYRAGKLR